MLSLQSFLRKGTLLGYVGSIENLMDLKGRRDGALKRRQMLTPHLSQVMSQSGALVLKSQGPHTIFNVLFAITN
jgi:hypothetical protein